MAGRKETGRKRKGEEEKEAKKENMHPWSSTRGLKHLHRAFPNSLSKAQREIGKAPAQYGTVSLHAAVMEELRFCS